MAASSFSPNTLYELPSELLQHIFLRCTTVSLLQVTSSCRKLFDLVSKSREVVLYHLNLVPGHKTGTKFNTLSTSELFLLLRQRASSNLYGANFSADRHDYLFRNADLNPAASFLAQNTDYLDMALVVRNSLRLRVYGGQCAAKEQIDSPFADGVGKILKVCQQNYTISVLYQWSPETDSLEGEEEEEPGFAGRVNDVLLGEIDEPDSDKEKEDKTKFLLMHYSAYSYDRPVVFVIPRHKSLVPVDLAVQYRLLCAILWDGEGSSFSRPTSSAAVVTYSTERLPKYQLGTYVAKQVWSCGTNSSSDGEDDDNESDTEDDSSLLQKPRRIAFFKDGRKLKLYCPGSILPFRVVSSSSPSSTAISTTPTPPNNTVLTNGRLFTIETPFFGLHHTSLDPDTNATPCDVTYLCLGITTFRGQPILCILRHKERRNYDECRHIVELDDMPHARQAVGSVNIVARLWGWYPQDTNLTGLETVSVSKRGTRIAIGLWNRVLVYAIEPSMLCEVWEEVHEMKNKRDGEVRVRGEGLRYYGAEHVSDDTLGEIVVLKPIALELGDAVLWKMMWRLNGKKKEEEADDESSDEDEDEEDDTDEEDSEMLDVTPGPSNEADKQALDPALVQTPTHLPQGMLDEHIPATKVNDKISAMTPTEEVSSSPDGEVLAESEAQDTEMIESIADALSTDPAFPEQSTTATASQPEPASSDDPTTSQFADEFTLIVPPATSTTTTTLPSTFTSLTFTPIPPLRPLSNPAPSQPIPSLLPPFPPIPTPQLNDHDQHESLVSNEKKPHIKRKPRRGENELVVLTDKGIQIWDLATWPGGRGRRVRKYLDEHR